MIHSIMQAHPRPGVIRGHWHWCPHDVEETPAIPSNPLFPTLRHSVTMAVTWDQVLEFILEPHASLAPPRPAKPRPPSTVFHRSFVGQLRKKARVFTKDPRAALYTMQYFWTYCRTGIFVSVRNGSLELFVPFCNMDYRNTWPEHVRQSFSPSRTLLPPEAWWLNGWVICDEIPDDLWGDHWVTTIRNMVRECCLGVDGDFIINKRDTPMVRKDGGDPMNPFTFVKVVDPHMLLPVFSFYSGPHHYDIACPLAKEWADHKGKVYAQKVPRTVEPPLVDLYWAYKEDMVVFRGSTTGTGQRTMLSKVQCKYADIKFTSCNRRRKIDPQTHREVPHVPVDASRANFMPMNRQQEEYKFSLYINGHSAPDRAARLFNGSQVVIKVDSMPSDIGCELWFTPMLMPFVHYIPVRRDLADLERMAKWIIGDTAAQAQYLSACADLPLGMKCVAEWWSIALM